MIALPVTGLHHVRIPVTDLDRSIAFWSELGFVHDFDFPERAGVAVRSGSASVVLWLDPERARAAAGSVIVGIGVPDQGTLERLAVELDDRGVRHGGIQPAFVEAKLPFVEDPDGTLIGFYVMPAAA